ncbi:MAG: glutathione S-transferase N-terminal domain-containing protein [Proteobacteria bacterium]|nr:glutathione S-transferase N-terminal domain-containing protein [Pseudomonadota bacterium]
MKLFWTPASPFTRKVCVTARELGLWDRIEVAPTVWPLDWGYATVSFTEGLAEANPVARIPTLVTDDDVPLGDSTLICQHLNSLAPNAGVIPEGADQWRMWSRYAVADGILEAQVAMRAELLRPTAGVSQGFLAKQRDRIARCFDHLEQRADEFDGPLDLTQITAGMACGYQDWRDWLDDFRPGRPRLARWYEAFSQRTAMKVTEPSETPAH